MTGLLGRNGAGKTTLLKLAMGVLFAPGGSVDLFGTPAAERLPETLSRTAFVPEQFRVPPLAVRQYVELHGGYYPRFEEDLMYHCLDRFALDRTAALPELSFGQQKKVLLAFALASGAELVILDEPTNGLDIPAKQVFRSFVRDAVEQGRTVVISTHQVRDVEHLVERVVILEEGAVLFQATLDAITAVLRVARFETSREAEAANALASDVGPGYVRALVPRERAKSPLSEEGSAGGVDLELLFQAAIERPKELLEACAYGRPGGGA